MDGDKGLPKEAVAEVELSIHTALVDGDMKSWTPLEICEIFQSTPPLWTVTGECLEGIKSEILSIHTALVDGDPLDKDSHTEILLSIHTALVDGDYIGAYKQ